MISGNPSSFAIDFALEEVSGSARLGTMKLIIAGNSLGEPEMIASLSAAANVLIGLTHTSPSRYDERLWLLPPEDVLEEVFATLYKRKKSSLAEASALENRLRPFLLCPDINEAFDNEVIVVVEREGVLRFVWRGRSRSACSAIVRQVDVASAIAGFVHIVAPDLNRHLPEVYW